MIITVNAININDEVNVESTLNDSNSKRATGDEIARIAYVDNTHILGRYYAYYIRHYMCTRRCNEVKTHNVLYLQYKYNICSVRN